MEDSPDIFADSEDFMNIDIPEEIEQSETKRENESPSWRGASMNEIYGSDSPWSAPEFPKVVPAFNHSVLYHLNRTTFTYDISKPPVPQQGKDVWNKDFVRMPFSSQSLYPVEEGGETILKNRWWLIKTSLSKPINNSHKLEEAILEYNSKYRKQWKFTALHLLFNEYLEEEETEYFFNQTLPMIIDLALKLPDIVMCPIPLLKQNNNKSISLSQLQIASLLANAFLCTFPRRNSTKVKSEYSTYPDINFNRLFQSGTCKSVLEKLKCICHYFRRICANGDIPCGVVTFTRCSVESQKCPAWSKSSALIGSIPIHVNAQGTIEDEGVGLLQVDFANKFLGGGVLGRGCVQEEIRFVICPELMISMLFTEALRPNEALLMIGCERYSNYAGYADSFHWTSDYIDQTIRDLSGRLRCAVVAIDALSLHNPSVQYKPEYITRELNKAWAGFSIHSDTNQGYVLPGVSTGNWGCGAFGGSPYLKSLIQLMTCCKARRPMVYFTFGNVQLRNDIVDMYNFLSQNNITVGELYKYLCEFHKSSASENHLYPFLLQCHKDSHVNDVKKIVNAVSSNIKRNVPVKLFYENESRFKTTSNVIEKPNLSEAIAVSADVEDQSNLGDEDTVEVVETTHLSMDQQSTSKPSLFDSITCLEGDNASSFDNSNKKKSFSFFDRSVGKTSSTDKSVGEDSIKDNTSPQSKKNRSETPPKKFTKISDYFQKLQKN